jgi:hypothetical protein
MELPSEKNPIIDTSKQEDEIKGWYQEVLADFRRIGFEPTPAEAAYLRQLIVECLDENEKCITDGIDTYQEIFERFFWNYYGINLSELPKPDNSKDPEDNRRIFIKFLEKLRKDRELI